MCLRIRIIRRHYFNGLTSVALSIRLRASSPKVSVAARPILIFARSGRASALTEGKARRRLSKMLRIFDLNIRRAKSEIMPNEELMLFLSLCLFFSLFADVLAIYVPFITIAFGLVFGANIIVGK